MATDSSHPLDGDELVAAVLDGEATPADQARLEADPDLSGRLARFREAASAVAAGPAPLSDPQRERLVAAALDSGGSDEVVSSVFDGVASADEQARVERDQALSERLDRFKEVAAAVAEAPPPLADDDRRRTLAAALAATSDSDAGGGHAEPPVASLAGRRRRSGRLPPVGLVAAVVVALLVVAVSLIVVGNNSTSNNQALSSASTDTASGADLDAGAGAPDRAAPEAGVALTTLGEYPDASALRESLKGLDPTTLRPTPDESPTTQASSSPGTIAPALGQLQIDRCDNATRSQDNQLAGAPTGTARATVGGQQVLLFSYPVKGGRGPRLYAVSVITCEVVLAVQT